MKQFLALIIISVLLTSPTFSGHVTFPQDLSSEHDKLLGAHVTNGDAHDHTGGAGAPIPNLPTANEKAAIAGTNGTPSASNKFATNSDPRNSDARTPTAHGSDKHTGTIGTWEQLDKTNASLEDLTSKSHYSLTDKGQHGHSTIDTLINNSWAWNYYGTTSTITGWSSLWYQDIYWKKIGSMVFVSFYLHGVSNSTSASFTLPFASNAPTVYHGLIRAADNSTWVTAGLYTLAQGSSTVNLYKDSNQTAFTNSGNKTVAGQFFYEPAP